VSQTANQKIAQLTEQIEKQKSAASVKEQALTSEIAQAKVAHQKEKDALLEKIASASKPLSAPVSTPVAKVESTSSDDSKIASLEAQVQELSDAVEMLTLDKEQCTIDLELSEEKNAKLVGEVSSLKAQIHAMASADENTAKLTSLTEENDKLREALRRLHATSLSDREAAKKSLDDALHALEEASTTSKEATELREYKARTEQQLSDLKQSVDAAAGYEAMVEALSEKNMTLQQKLQVWMSFTLRCTLQSHPHPQTVF